MTTAPTFVGKPCRHGHDGTRYSSTKQCVACAASASRRWKDRHSEEFKSRHAAAQRRWREEHRDEYNAYMREYMRRRRASAKPL